MKKSYPTATDQFCGAGGSSIGATTAGIELKLALNHWRLAVETHSSNFPDALHDCTDISASNPRRYPSTDFLITSPECTNHSLANGKARKFQQQLDLFGKVTIDPAEERSRATMWDVPRFAEYHKYNIIIVENVVDARTWVMWDAWLLAMDLLGYNHKCVYLNSMFAHPTPQSRDRMYVVFWKKGNKTPDLEFCPSAHCYRCESNVQAVQAWKKQRWGRYRKQYVYVCPTCQSIVEPYYYCAANVIDWSIPAQRIGDRQKPLKEKTLKRIQAGLDKFGRQVIMADMIHSARNGRDQDMVWSTASPNRTQIGQATQCLIMPPLVIDVAYTHSESNRSRPVTDPLPTQTSRQTHGIVIPPFSIDLRGENAPKTMADALSTVCASGNHHGLVIPFLAGYYGTDNLSPLDKAVPTVTTNDRHGLVVPPFILSYYTRESGQRAALASINDPLPTQPTWPVHYLTQPGETPAVEDCGFRMLQPHEIQKAMAFPDSYMVKGNGREKVKQLGNAVTPPVMAMLIERCMASLE